MMRLFIPAGSLTFNLIENKVNRISLSWHLTAQEKKHILNAYSSPANQQSFNKLAKLLK